MKVENKIDMHFYSFLVTFFAVLLIVIHMVYRFNKFVLSLIWLKNPKPIKVPPKKNKKNTKKMTKKKQI